MKIGKRINEEHCNNIFNNIWHVTDLSVNLSLKNFVWFYVHDKVRRNINEMTNIIL